MSKVRPRSVPIAVVGLSALLPGSNDVDGFWRAVLQGRDLITDVPESHWLVEDYYDPDPKAPDKTYGKRGAFLDPVNFDPLAFGVPPNQMAATDTTQLLSLLVADQVLKDATGGRLSELDRERISVILGTAPLELLATMASRLQRPVWLKALRESGVTEADAQDVCDRIASHYVPWQEASFPGLLSNVVAGRIANKFDLHGTNNTTDAACASSLAALSAGVNELALGQADMVITGGVDTLNDITMYMCFSKTPALSPTGDCKPFSDAADGTILGEGLVMFALKRLADAERDGDRIYAVLKGVGTASDGRSTAIYAPLAEGQSRALRRAYEAAGYGPETVELVEAHGTGTTAGDLAEVTALRTVFSESGRADSQWCALGSVKSQIGHTKSAAGAAGMLKAVLALHHKVLPPTIKVDRPNPKLGLDDSPLYLNTQARPWIRDDSHPRRASVSSFGFGGSNFHLTLEEYMPGGDGAGLPAWRAHTAPTELVMLSAATPAELLGRAGALDVTVPLADLARETQSAFVPTDGVRLAIVASSEDFAAKLGQALAAIGANPTQAFTTPTGISYATGDAPSGRVGFLFSGQGSQYVGMGGDLAMEFPAARAAWDRAAGLSLGDRSLQSVVFPVPVFTDADRDAQQAALTATEWAQPALAVQSLAQLGLLDALKISPDAVAGHSFGELVALHTAGAFDAETLVHLARRRGEAMRDAASVAGVMLAVSAAHSDVQAVLSGVDGVWIANHNAPSQVVVSGSVSGIAAVEARFAAVGIATKRLDTATAFHSPLVAPASAALLSYLRGVEVSAPRIDVFGNTDAAVYPADADSIRSRVANHLAAPVRFVDEIEAMYAAGVRTFVEVGAGSTLTALVGKILGDRPHLAVSLDRKGRHGVTALHEALGRLAVNGIAADFDALWSLNAPPAEQPESKQPRMTIPLSGANYGKPYPPVGGASELPEPVAPAVVVPVVAAPVVAAPVVAARVVPAPVVPAPMPVVVAPEPVVRVAEPVVPMAAAAAPAGIGSELEQLVLSVVADKTGYPAEMLAGHMELEADLGIDSIKRVEILSAVRRSAPDLPEVDPVELGKLRSLGEIIDRLRATTGASGAPAPVPAATPVQTPVPIQPAAPAPVEAQLPAPAVAAVSPVDLELLVLDVVAEKTGYPAEMLAGHMELEADLGIDSIKRVEILSAVRRSAPDLPEVDPVELGKLRSLGEIIDRLRATTSSTPTAAAVTLAPVQAPAPVAAPAPAPVQAALSIDLEQLVLDVVADKTGYPAEMLAGHMELEADLGIDSIKRVEILSAVRRSAPDLPEVDPVELGKLRSLGEIIDRLRATTAGIAPTTTTEAPASHGTPVDGLARHAVRVVEAPAPGFALAGLRGGSLVVTDDGGGIAAQIVARLAAVGIKADVHSEVPADAHGVIYLGGLADVTDVDAALAIQRDAFGVARAVADRFAESGGVFVTAQDTGGDFGISGQYPDRAWLGGLAALTRTAAREWPAASVKAIDCERGRRTSAAVAEAIVRELLTGGSTIDVGLRANGMRTTIEAVPTQVEPASATNISRDSVIVATGGARGVTAEALRALAQAHQPKLVLLGRTPLAEEPAHLRGVADETSLKRLVVQYTIETTGKPPLPAKVNAEVAGVLAAREIQATLSGIRAAGSEVRYLAIDARDGAKLTSALDHVRKDWGPITGIVHGAGVLADKRIAEKTDEQFDRVFDTKVAGLRALLAATANDPLSVLCVFSSISAHVGNPGQCDYAMANEVLNHVAHAQRANRPELLVRSIAWGPWEGGMVSPSLAEHFHRQGVPLIPVHTGARAFVAELTGAPDDAHVVIAAGENAGPIDGSTVDLSKGEIQLNARSHPYLADHDIEGTPVVPVALVLEWFTAAARAWLPDTGQAVIRDVSVLRKIGLERYTNGGNGLTIQGSRDAGEPLALEVLGDGNSKHYRAKASGGATAEPATWTVPADLQPVRPDIYGGRVLFHGPQFQAIREVEGISASGAAAVLTGARDLGWSGATWHTDPAAVDGGLQLALLWAEQVLGGASLPMGVTEYRTYQPGLYDGPTRCVLMARSVWADGAECDIAFLDEDGAVRAELIGVSLVLRPA